MRSRTITSLVLLALLATASLGVSKTTSYPVQKEAESTDKISGEWEAFCEIGGGSATLILKFKLDGEKVTGTGESAHTGPGVITKGSWADKKLNFTLEFAAHESIAVAGTLQDDKLSGEFHTEGMVGKWVAKRKNSSTNDNHSSAAPRGNAPWTAAVINGQWEATFDAQGTTVSATFNLRVDGDKITG